MSWARNSSSRRSPSKRLMSSKKLEIKSLVNLRKSDVEKLRQVNVDSFLTRKITYYLLELVTGYSSQYCYLACQAEYLAHLPPLTTKPLKPSSTLVTSAKISKINRGFTCSPRMMRSTLTSLEEICQTDMRT